MTSLNEQNLSQDIAINASLNNKSTSSDELINDSQKRSDQCKDHDSKIVERSNVDESSTTTIQDNDDASRNHFHLSDFGDRVVGTVKHGLDAVFGTDIKNINYHDQEPTSRRSLALRSTSSRSVGELSSPEIVREQISETEEELLFVFPST
ncbi:17846_t:CDS:2 [Funneliformis geosporum]|uniref:8014_t:CDS:1 n=1 Tax=Funneliformis geosporum TaxID=1117311 RepID=A0A9W4X051_9GLOM|nr:8014_t:CDS:2 [Funneliformis geosporum]CAI2184872.1 17846_t:CDS:2 [Funneliformis geosporum]